MGGEWEPLAAKSRLAKPARVLADQRNESFSRKLALGPRTDEGRPNVGRDSRLGGNSFLLDLTRIGRKRKEVRFALILSTPRKKSLYKFLFVIVLEVVYFSSMRILGGQRRFGNAEKGEERLN